MAGSINIPKDLGKTVEITVKDNSDSLRRFLIDMAIRLEAAEEEIRKLKEAQ